MKCWLVGLLVLVVFLAGCIGGEKKEATTTIAKVTTTQATTTTIATTTTLAITTTKVTTTIPNIVTTTTTTTMNKLILRQFGDLTSEDFINNNVWVNCHTADYDEPWYEETDEETFRPWTGSTPVNPEENMFLILSSFKLADGTILNGFITPQKSENVNSIDMGYTQPNIFTKSGKRVPFWYGMIRPSEEEINNFYFELNKTPDEVFPITFEVNTHLSEGITSGVIDGFYSIDKNDKIFIKKTFE